MAKIGRPTIFCKEVTDEICSRLSMGESLRSICKDEHMPSFVTVFAWLNDKNDPQKVEFSKQYETARNNQAEHLFEELLDIADDGSNDWVLRTGKDGQEWWQLNGEHVQRSRLRVDTRKWYLSKVLPKKYGDKVDLTSDGKELKFIPILGGQSNVQSNDSNKEDTEVEQAD